MTNKSIEPSTDGFSVNGNLTNKTEYKYDLKDILDKVYILEKMIDQSRFTGLSLTMKSGWTFNISHKKRNKIFLETGKIERFVKEDEIQA